MTLYHDVWTVLSNRIYCATARDWSFTGGSTTWENRSAVTSVDYPTRNANYFGNAYSQVAAGIAKWGVRGSPQARWWSIGLDWIVYWNAIIDWRIYTSGDDDTSGNETIPGRFYILGSGDVNGSPAYPQGTVRYAVFRTETDGGADYHDWQYTILSPDFVYDQGDGYKLYSTIGRISAQGDNVFVSLWVERQSTLPDGSHRYWDSTYVYHSTDNGVTFTRYTIKEGVGLSEATKFYYPSVQAIDENKCLIMDNINYRGDYGFCVYTFSGGSFSYTQLLPEFGSPFPKVGAFWRDPDDTDIWMIKEDITTFNPLVFSTRMWRTTDNFQSIGDAWVPLHSIYRQMLYLPNEKTPIIATCATNYINSDFYYVADLGYYPEYGATSFVIKDAFWTDPTWEDPNDSSWYLMPGYLDVLPRGVFTSFPALSPQSSATQGIVLQEDRAAYDTVNYPNLHARDIYAILHKYHIPKATDINQGPMWDGEKWALEYLITSGSAGGHEHVEADITDMDHDAVEIQGEPITTDAPTNDSFLRFDGNEWMSQELISEKDTLGLKTIGFLSSGSLGTSGSTGDMPVRMVAPWSGVIQEVNAQLGTAPQGQSILIDIDLNDVTIFTDQDNRLEILEDEQSGTATPDVTAIEKEDVLTLSIDQLGSTVTGSDLVVQVLVQT